MKILLIEDDPGIGRVIVKGFDDENIKTHWLRTGSPALGLLTDGAFDLVVLDLMLPDLDGRTLAADLRRLGLGIPILMLTARSGLEEKLEGFRAGADDYLTKPFHFEELLARVLALGRRAQSSPQAASLTVGNLMLDTRAREGRIGNMPLDLTRTEFDVLLCLAEQARNAVSREDIISRVWGHGADISSNAVEVYVGYLRKKLSAVEGAPAIQTVRGLGYLLTGGIP